MGYLYSIVDKILFVILLMGTGVLAKKLKWISEEGEKDISRLMVDFVWPSLIFSSIVTTLTTDDILSNFFLPVLSVFIHITGYGLGLLICRLTRYTGERRKIFLLHAAMNNFFVMALPFAQFFFPEKGAALLAVANLGSMILLWTLGVSIIAGNLGARASIKNIFSPGMIATVAGVVCVLTGANRYIPRLVSNVLSEVGQPTMLFGLMIAGTQIYKLGRNALKFDGWNILVGLVRNILTPAILFALILPLRDFIGKEGLTIFMIVSMTPASVNSVTLAMKYDSAPNLAAEGVIFTHILAIGTMLGFVVLIERFLLT
jgi:predicted permease